MSAKARTRVGGRRRHSIIQRLPICYNVQATSLRNRQFSGTHRTSHSRQAPNRHGTYSLYLRPLFSQQYSFTVTNKTVIQSLQPSAATTNQRHAIYTNIPNGMSNTKS